MTKRMIFIVLLTLVVSIFCYEWKIQFNLSPIDTIYYTIIVFPLGVILGQAEAKRFRVLEVLSLIKAHIIALAFAYRDRDHDKEMNKKYNKTLIHFVREFKSFLSKDVNNTFLYRKKTLRVEKAMGQISALNEHMRIQVTSSDLSRANQYVSKIMNNFEILKGYKVYGTSHLIINFLEVTLIVGGFLLIPHFTQNGISGIFVSPIITLIFLILIKIERILDNPLTRDDIVDTIDMRFGKSLHERLDGIFAYKRDK